MITTSPKKLKTFLDQLQKDFHKTQFLSSDPLEFAHRYQNPQDQEAIALLAAVLAYGNVKQIRNALQDALSRIHQLSDTPTKFIEKLNQTNSRNKALQKFETFVHRFNSGSDIILLFQLLHLSWKKFGSLGNHFSCFLQPTDSHIEQALSLFISEWRGWLKSSKIQLHPMQSVDTFSYLLTSPQDGSCCKRWCMFLRWMGRKDEVDLGLWSSFLKPNQLIMPLDTHTGRISQYLGLTLRKSLNWKAAVEVTESLKAVDPADPTRYDFAISRLGILDICQRTYRKEICRKCQLLPVCQFSQIY